MEKIKIGLEWFFNPDHLAFIVAREKGYLKEAGIEIELVEPSDHYEAATMLAQGTLDVAITEPIHLVLDTAQGHDLVGFTRFLHTDGGVMYLEKSGIRSPKDMAGRRLQYPGAPGKLGYAIAHTMMRFDGAEASATIRPVDNSFYHTNALAEDKADMATLVFYNFEVLEAKSRNLSPRFFSLKEWGVPDFCQLHLVTTRDVFRKKYDLWRRLHLVLSRAVSFLKTHPEEARDIWQKNAQGSLEGLNAEIFSATAACFVYDFGLSSDYLRVLTDWCAEHSLIETKPEAEKLWENFY